MATEASPRPEDVRALKAASACREVGGNGGRALSAKLTGLVGAEDVGRLLAATHQAEAWLGLKDFNPGERRDYHGRWTHGDKVTYQHGYLGKLDATVTKVTGKFPKEKIHVAYEVDGEPHSTVMTTNQAAVKLEKKKP